MKSSKKAIILEYIKTQRPTSIGRAEVDAMQRLLRQKFAEKGRVSQQYLLDVLESTGIPVDASVGGLPSDLLEILKFDTLHGAEQAIRAMETMRQAGRADCIRAGRRALERAERVSRNPAVRAAIRVERAEIALWFRVWLESPELFDNWLEVRRASDEFCTQFLL